jgi:hypothetical protein
MVEQHFHIMFRRGQIADPQRDRACRHGESVTQRDCVIGRASVRDTGFGGPHRLIRQSLQPQDPGKVGPRRHPRVDPKANDLRLLGRSDIVGEHALEMAPRAERITQVMLRRTDHLFPDQAIVRLGPAGRQSIEPSSQGQSDAMLAADDAKGP